MNLIFAIACIGFGSAGVPALRPIVGEITRTRRGARRLRYGTRSSDGGRPTPTLEAATLAILEDLTDDGTINCGYAAGGAERELSLPVGDRSRALTQPESLLPGWASRSAAARAGDHRLVNKVTPAARRIENARSWRSTAPDLALP